MALGWWECKGGFKCQMGQETGPGLRKKQHFLFVLVFLSTLGFFILLNVHGHACSSKVPSGMCTKFVWVEMGEIRVSRRVAHTLYFLDGLSHK